MRARVIACPPPNPKYVQTLVWAAINHMGGQALLAKKMRVHKNSVYMWANGRSVPNAEHYLWLQNRYGKWTSV